MRIGVGVVNTCQLGGCSIVGQARAMVMMILQHHHRVAWREKEKDRIGLSWFLRYIQKRRRFVSVFVGISVQRSNKGPPHTTMMMRKKRLMVALVTALICSYLTGAWSPAHKFGGVQNAQLCLFSRATSSNANADEAITTTTTTASSSTILLPLSTAARDLQNLLKAQDDSPVQVEGYITAKRGFGDSFCFLDLTDSDNFESPVQVMVKRQEFEADGGDRRFDGYMKSMLPGARVRISGISSPSRNPDEALLLARRMRLVGLPQNPQFIGAILQAVHDGLLPLEEVARAANWSVSDLSDALKDTAAASVGVSPSQQYPASWKGLAKAVRESMPPPEENFPYDILRRKHDQGVYTLPRPEEEFRHPPALVLQSILQPNSSDDAATIDALSSSTICFFGTRTHCECDHHTW